MSDLMMRLKTVVTVFLVLFANRLSIATSAPSNAPQYSAVFAFGDSILDTGNNNFLITMSKCNFPPYGRDFYGGQATGRFGDGRVLSDLITAALGVKETLPAYLGGRLQTSDLPTGVCFASGGSGIDDLTANVQHVLTLTKQLGYFESYLEKLRALVGEEKAKSIIANALFLFSSGNNDIAAHFLNPVRIPIPFSTYVQQLAGGAESFFKKLYELGARHVWALSTVPIGCLPAGRTVGGGPLRLCTELGNAQAQEFNYLLASSANRLRTAAPDYDIKFIDIYTPMLRIINNPFSNGFVNAWTGCCATGTYEMGPFCNMFSLTCLNPTSYFFWDAAHPSQRAYQLTVAAILQNQNVDITSYNVTKALGPLNLNTSVLHY